MRLNVTPKVPDKGLSVWRWVNWKPPGIDALWTPVSRTLEDADAQVKLQREFKFCYSIVNSREGNLNAVELFSFIDRRGYKYLALSP